MKPVFPLIEIDRFSGFCSGVKRAIRIAEEELKDGKPIYCLGNLVHNEQELGRLEKLGMQFIRRDEIDSDKPAVFIRAHGEPPSTFRLLDEVNAKVTDATCPVVLRLQHKVKESSRLFQEAGEGTVIIFGKPGHPEIVGLLGQTSGNALLISKIEEADLIDCSQPMHVYAQTTAGEEEYKALCRRITERSYQQTGSKNMVTITHSICRQMSRRAPELREFAKKHDVIIFVSGSESSNGRYLAGVARSANPETYVIGGPDEVADWFSGAGSIGISGATSTPLWLMENVARRVRTIITSKR